MGMFNLISCFSRRLKWERIYHSVLLFVISVYVLIAVCIGNYMYDENGPTLNDTIAKYGYIVTIVLYAMSFTVFASIPISLLNMIGLILYNPFKTLNTKHRCTTETPFICFRVVTKGLFPQLVADITDTNLEVCRKVGLTNFKFEIVTDTPLYIKTSNFVREIVVPVDYQTPNRTLFKARALNYCLSTNINILSHDDWIVHLDEETLLTENALHGIVDFILKPDSNIGQGVITYAGCGVENWITTLLDGIRVVIDYGLFQLGLALFHVPVFGFKGSFVVVKMGIEQRIGFDFGPRECIAEDLRFALTAWTQNYKFDFIHGIMREKSPFSIADFIKQRKRWFIGHFHIAWSNTLPLYCKLFVLPMNIVNMLLWTNAVNFFCCFLFPVSVTKFQFMVYVLLTANGLFMLSFGNFMSFSHERYSLVSRILVSLTSQLCAPLSVLVEAWACIRGVIDRNKIAFDIVKKETGSQTRKSQASECISNTVCEDHVV